MLDAELKTILERLVREGGDDSSFEAKKCTSELSKDVCESVSAFANSGGGTILLGISEEDGFVPVTGFQTQRVCNQFVAGMGDGGKPSVLTNPPEYSIDRVAIAGEVILVIRIEGLNPSQKPCYITARGIQGGSYKRVDDKDVRLSPNELYSLQAAVSVDASERDAVSGATIGDLDQSVYEQIITKALAITPRSLKNAQSVEERLKRLNLINNEGRVIRAGILVAGTYPQQFFPKLCVDVAVHPGTTKGTDRSMRFFDRAVCEGTLGEMIEDAVLAMVKNLRRRSFVNGAGRIDELEIPESVLREAITNALVHRSYNARFDGESVSVDIYDDRVEIINPGGLWGKSPDDLADGRSCCRNPALMKLMSLTSLPSGSGSPAEGNGSGILYMMSEMAARGLEAPVFYPSFDHFKVILMRRQDASNRDEAISKGAEFVELMLKAKGEMSLRELAEETGMTINQVRKRVNDLIAAGRVKPTAPSKSRNRKYRLGS